MSRLYEALNAIDRKAHVLARTDLPLFRAEVPARRLRLVILLGIVVVVIAGGLGVMLRAPSSPSTSPPLPSVPRPETIRAPELRERAREASELGGLVQAQELLERAVALAHDDAPAWNDLGVVLVRLGQRRRGIEAFERSLALDPKRAEAHRNLAVALEQDGKAPGAAAHYRAFLALAPQHPERAQIEQRLASLLRGDGEK